MFYLIPLPDHPRRCGENLYQYSFSPPSTGSPPQVRGKHKEGLIFISRDRITPAGAGKTGIASIYSKAERDHPRRCGENCYNVFIVQPRKGSPPQVRGKRTDTRRLTAHCGSPPQVRGKQKDCHPIRHGDRITPAGAGKTAKIKILCCSHRDHPRRCGENSISHARSSA